MNKNVFIKSNDQSQTCLSFGMTRKGRMKSNTIKSIIVSALSILMLGVFGGAFVSCTSDNEEARTPIASVQVNKTNLKVNETMEIVFTGVADQVVVFTGDNMHEYAKRAESNTGVPVSKGFMTYSYSVPGTFHVTVIASTYDTYLGDNQKIDLYEFDVTVVDDNTTIETIYSVNTLNTYIAQMVDEKDWVICLPNKQVNSASGKEVTFNPGKQRLTFTVGSDSTKVYINGAEYKTNAYYNLKQVNDIHVVANSGDTRDYRLIGLVFPELANPKAGENTLKQVRDAFNPDLLTYVYPADADVSDVELTFTLDDNVILLRNGQAVESGTSLNLTDEATYTLVRTSVDNPLAQAVSRILFKAE